MTKTQAALSAVKREIERHQQLLDSSTDTAQVKITLRFHAETGQIRSIIWEEERLSSRNALAAKVSGL